MSRDTLRGRFKQRGVWCSYDAERGISRLAEGWVSLAAAQQRRGRAGRVQPGACFKLFSRHQATNMQVRACQELSQSSHSPCR